MVLVFSPPPSAGRVKHVRVGTADEDNWVHPWACYKIHVSLFFNPFMYIIDYRYGYNDNIKKLDKGIQSILCYLCFLS